jgi:hypothetical protein
VAHRGRRNADEALALALAAGRTLRDAAAEAGIGEQTATRRWADPAFRRRVSDLRGELVGRAVGQLADGMADAAGVLRQLLDAVSESVRRGACRALLELTVKLGDAEEVARRLEELEQRLEEMDGAGRR